MNTDPEISIIIVNWNGWEDTLGCLESLYQISYENYHVIVVDNGSEDESLQKIRQYSHGEMDIKSPFYEYSSSNKPITKIEYSREEAEGGGGKEGLIAGLPSRQRLILIKNEANYGFAAGNNIAIRYSLRALDPDYILLLNNDTVVDVDFLSQSVRFAESQTGCGIVGSKIFYYDFNGRRDVIQSCGSRIDFYRGVFNHYGNKESDSDRYSVIREVDYVSGACMLIKRELLESSGLLDDRYYCYFEDTDFCLRAIRKGYAICCTPGSKVWHKELSSAKKIPGFSIYHMTRNMLWFERKYANRLQYIIFLLYFLAYRFPRMALGDLLKKDRFFLLKKHFHAVKDGLLMPRSVK